MEFKAEALAEFNVIAVLEELGEKTPARPPDNYTGELGRWCDELYHRGLWDGTGFFGDVVITCKDYVEILDVCEGRGVI